MPSSQGRSDPPACCTVPRSRHASRKVSDTTSSAADQFPLIRNARLYTARAHSSNSTPNASGSPARTRARRLGSTSCAVRRRRLVPGFLPPGAAADLGNRGAVQPAGHLRVPERRPRRHGLVACEVYEGDGQVAMHWATQLDRFEHRPVWVGDQPPESVQRKLLGGGLDEVRAPQLPSHRNRSVGAGGGELAYARAHLLGQGIGGRLPVFEGERVAVDQPGHLSGALVGDLANGHAAEAVPGEDHRAGTVGGDGGKHGRHVVVVANPGPVLTYVTPPRQGRGDHAVAVGAQAVANAVPAPGALPGAVHENECLCVCHAFKTADLTTQRSSRRVVILPRAASRAVLVSSRRAVILWPGASGAERGLLVVTDES